MPTDSSHELFSYGLDLASKGQKSEATQVLTSLLKHLDWNDPSHREMIVTSHLRLSALCSDIGMIQDAADHAEWILKNAPPSDMALRMIMEINLENAGRKHLLSSPKSNTAASSSSASSSGSCLLIVLAALICVAVGIYVIISNKNSTNIISEQPKNIRRINTENLNLRSGPGANQSITAVLS